MRYEWLDEYLLSKRNVTKDLQPVWNWIRYHIGGKMFAAVCLDEEDRPCYINLKADPAESSLLQRQYEEIIPGYYSDKKNWISVKPDGQVPDWLLMELLDRAYRLMLNSFSRKRQREILGLTCCGTECGNCGLYGRECTGCNQSAGRVFHAPEGKACPIYACSVQKHRYASCAGCGELSCSLWRTVRDPEESEEEWERSLKDREKRLRESW